MCDYDYTYTEISSRMVTTRKPHECGSCMQKFPTGTKMKVAVGLTDGDLGRTYACPACEWCLNQPDETDLHLCWGWNWDESIYDDSHDRWEYVNKMLAAGETPTIDGYKKWLAENPKVEQ